MATGDNLGGGRSVHANLSVRGSVAGVGSDLSIDDSSEHFIHNIRMRPVIGALLGQLDAATNIGNSRGSMFRHKLRIRSTKGTDASCHADSPVCRKPDLEYSGIEGLSKHKGLMQAPAVCGT